MRRTARNKYNSILLTVVILEVLVGGCGAYAQASLRVSAPMKAGCSPVDNAKIVINGDEMRAASLDKTGNGKWSPSEADMSATTFTGSLRLGGRRTYCKRVPTPFRFRLDFNFDCGQPKVRQVNVILDSASGFSYVRRLSKGGNLRDDCNCVEFGTLPRGESPIADVLFPEETLFLQFDRDKPDREGTGLSIDDKDVIPNAEKKGGQITFNAIEIAAALEKQRLRRGDTAHQVDGNGLRKRGVKSVTIKVE